MYHQGWSDWTSIRPAGRQDSKLLEVVQVEAPPRVKEKNYNIRIVIVNYNSEKFILKALSCLEKQSYSDFEVVVVDNASQDNSVAKISFGFPNVKIVALRSNIGFAAASNIGAQGFMGAWLVMLNPDAFPRVNWLRELVLATERFPDAALFGSTQLQHGAEGVLDGTGDNYLFCGLAWRGGFGRPVSLTQPDREVFSPCAAAAMYRSDLFFSLGGFDSRYFCYYEDVDFGFRARLAGHHAMQIQHAVVEHVGSAICGRRSEFSCYYGMRNMIWTYWKNMPLQLLVPLLPVHLFCVILFSICSLIRDRSLSSFHGAFDAFVSIFSVLSRRSLLLQYESGAIVRLVKILSWSPLRFIFRSV
jgi:GT2 family glycosyltransferase